MEYRVFNKLNSSVFNLIGKDEPSQTKGLGYLLARSPSAMKGFLDLLSSSSPSLTGKEVGMLLTCNWIVDCEERNTKGKVNSQRTDIVVRFYQGFTPVRAILVEAKGIGVNVKSKNAATQATSYLNSFPSLLLFQGKTLIVTLTKYRSFDLFQATGNLQHVIMLLWQSIQEQLLIISSNKKTNHIEKELIGDYLNYLSTINCAMKFYNEEVLVIPANRTYQTIQQSFFYECAVGSPHCDARANSHPLFIAFKVKGRITRLYKIKEIVKASLQDTKAISYLTNMYPYLASGLSSYVNQMQTAYNKLSPQQQKKSAAPGDDRWVFVLDNTQIITLPKPFQVRYCRTHSFYSLYEVLK